MQVEIVSQVLKELNKPIPFYIGNRELIPAVDKLCRINGVFISRVGVGRAMAALGHKKYQDKNGRGWIVSNIIGEKHDEQV